MKTATVKLRSASPYSQSRLYSEAEVPKLEKENAADRDLRCWRHHQHFIEDTGEVFIPPMALKNCLAEAAQYLSEKIPGKRNGTWTKHFLAGVLCEEPALLGVNKDETKCESFPCHSDGKRGSGSRVTRTFPVIHQWHATAKFLIFDETITENAFRHHLEEAGKFIGIGRFRPRNGGFYGRFIVESIVWE